MISYFIWNGEDSNSHGLWVSQLPDITRPAERTKQIKIPGRAGELTMTEGDEAYEAYRKDIVVTCRNEHVTPALMDWLRGSGKLIVGNEDQYVYNARIAAEVSFSRLGNWMSQATVSFWCEPFKYSRYPSSDTLTLSASGTIRNPGTAISRPKITIKKPGETTIAVGDRSMYFAHMPDELVIDCDAEIITTKAKAYVGTNYYYVGDYCTYTGDQNYAAGLYRFTTENTGSLTEWEYVGAADNNFWYAWPGRWTGDFLRIMPGANTFTLTTNSSSTDAVVIDPNWRWV